METKRKCISIMVPTYNEEENVIPLCAAIVAELEGSLPQYDYEIVFIDNCSTDTTREKLRALCAENPRVRAIFNARNFGQFNSPYHGICQTKGDCTIPVCADFQDPIEMIPRLVAKWEEGYKIVCAIKTTSKENKLVRFLRTCYYKMIRKMSTVEQIEHFTGFGLYDRSFVEVLRGLDDPSPFIRGIIAEIGFGRVEIPYEQAKRRAGKTHNNYKTLYDAAMLSFTTYTKTPIRFFTGLGCFLGGASFLGGAAMLVLKLLGIFEPGFWWLVPIMTLLASLQLVAVGILGEYVLTLRSKLMKRPLVIEQERINFEEKDGE
ncbi:MAG: glycosyltransferase family 2 protein [Ruminococcaceae bacterium]|nr:glycosyltransferase family 2 protein [Oscillospiraceae bacterium]